MNNNIDIKQIGTRIRDARITKKLSQEDLADKACTSVSLISDIELGKSDMRLSTFIKIIEALDISADQILRANTSTVNNIYQNELSALLNDCSSKEMNTIIELIKNIKKTIHLN